MNNSLLAVIVLIVLIIGSAVTTAKKACKSGYHTWCVTMDSVRHHSKTQPPV